VKRVLIIGASGFIGQAIYAEFKKDDRFLTCGTYLNNEIEELELMDMTSKESIEGIFRKIAPQIVLIAASLTNVEYCEINREKAREINVLGVKNIVDVCKMYDSRVIYISTDYVFDGENGPYTEEDLTSPLNFYGQTKLEAENEVRMKVKDYLIVRTTVVYGWSLESKNFIMQLINNLSGSITMRVPVDQIGSPTYAPNLAIMIKEAADKDITGVLNITGDDIIDRYGFAIKAAEYLGLNSSLIVPVETKCLGQIAKRPLKAGLVVNKAKALLNTKPMGIIQGLAEVEGFFRSRS